MSAHVRIRPGLLGRGFGGFWRLLDGTRRLLLNLLFLAARSPALVWALVTRGAAGAAGQDRAGARPARPGGRAAQRQLARHRARPRARRSSRSRCSCATCCDVLDAAAKDPKITPGAAAAGRLPRRRAGHAARAVRGGAALQGQRQAGGGLGFELRPAPVPRGRRGQRGAAAPDGHGADRRLRALPQLLPRRARQAGRHREPDPRRHLQELRRDLHRKRPVGGVDRGRAACSTTGCGPATPPTSRRRASCRPAALARGIDELPQRLAAAGGDLAGWRSTPSWWTG